MPRPRVHDTEALLDAATRIAAEHGAAGLTMSGLSQATGAPSGSLYHRFGSRDALLGAVWLRAMGDFQDGFVELLAREPVLEACVRAARHVVAYSRDHETRARVLLRGEREFAPERWPDDLRATGLARRAALAAALAEAGARHGDPERVLVATVDVPYAVVRRHLAAGTLPAGAEETVGRAACAILRS